MLKYQHYYIWLYFKYSFYFWIQIYIEYIILLTRKDSTVNNFKCYVYVYNKHTTYA